MKFFTQVELPPDYERKTLLFEAQSHEEADELLSKYTYFYMEKRKYEERYDFRIESTRLSM